MVERGILYIYFMKVREKWRFIPQGNSNFPRATPKENMSLGGNKFSYLLNVHAIHCLFYRTTGDTLEYTAFYSFFNSCKKVLNVNWFLYKLVFWYKTTSAMKIEVIINNILELFNWLHRMLILGNLNTYKMKISMASERMEYDKKNMSMTGKY